MCRWSKTVFLATAIAVTMVSCTREGTIIPPRKMKEIYCEMLLADEWLRTHPEKRSQADTTWFYEPIFNKYGYTQKDYRYTVEFYLNDPMRYSELMDKVIARLQSEAGALRTEAAREERLRQVADSVARVLSACRPDDLVLLFNLDHSAWRNDRMRFVPDGNGVPVLVPEYSDTLYEGPLRIVRQKEETDSAGSGSDSLVRMKELLQ